MNLGVSVQDFIESINPRSVYHELCCKYYSYDSDIKRCIYASNSLQTNFVLSNGFIIRNHRLICKSGKYDAMGLDCEEFNPLNGEYTALVFDAPNPHIMEIQFENGQVVSPSELPKLAIYGPVLIKNGNDVSKKVKYRPNSKSKKPFDLDLNNPDHTDILIDEQGPSQGCEVNFPPPTTMTSFTVFGVREDNHIIFVSMFEEFRGHGKGTNLGITIYEMAELLLTYLGATQAILGGGSGDTQQFLRGDQPQHMVAPIRMRPSDQGERPEVEGVRGLGAIIAVLAKA